MSECDNNEYEQEKMREKEEKAKNKKLMRNYYSNGYLLETQALRNGFGKMIRAVNQTNPKYSFGKEKRFFSVFKNDNLPYDHKSLEDEIYGNINIGYHNKVANRTKPNFTGTFNRIDSYSDYNKSRENINLPGINFISSANNATDYYYVPPPPHYYKYSKSPKWVFNRSKRSLYDDKGKYEHYNLPYNRQTDNDSIHKRWRNRIIGGDIGLCERFEENRKLAHNIATPGPGRYNPKDIYFKYTHYPGGYMGMKLDCCEPIKHKNLKNELNSCFNANQKMKKPIGSNKNFVFHDKIKFDLAKNNHIYDTYNGRIVYDDKTKNKNNKKENKIIKDFKRNFSLNEKRPLFNN